MKWINLGSKQANDVAVYLDAAFENELFAGTPRSDPSVREKFLKTNAQNRYSLNRYTVTSADDLTIHG